MFRRRHQTHFAAATLLALTAACSDGNAPDRISSSDMVALNADVAATTGAAVASDVAVWASNEAAVSAGFAGAGAPAAGSCTRSGNVTTCTGGRDGALTVTRTVGYFDAAGAAQQQFDAASTARVEFHVNVSGSVSDARGTSTIERARATSVSGLAGSETQRTWNGTGAATEQTTVQRQVPDGGTVTNSRRMVVSDTTTNVVWVVAPTRGAYPASGTIVRNVAVTTTISGVRSATFSVVRRVQTTFNGTAQVPVQVSSVSRRGTTVELTCQLDLSTRTVSCPQ